MSIQKSTYPFNNSCWIGYTWQVDCGGEQNRYYAFRNTLKLPSLPVGVTVYVTADARYILWVNNKFVGRGPARCFPDSQAYDEYDLTSFLKKGTNRIAVLVHQFGVSTGQYVHRMRTGLIMEGEVILSAGRKIPLCTDLSWQVCEADWYLRTHARLSQHLGFQERYDARLEPTGWRCPGRHGKSSSESKWKTPFYVGSPGCAPWIGFEPRGISALSETVVSPSRIRWGAHGLNAVNLMTEDNLLNLWREEKRKVLKILPKMENNGWIKIKPAKGKFVALAFDFDWCHSAYPCVEVQGAQGDEIIDNFYAAGFTEDNEPALLKGFGRSYEGFADRFIVSSGDSRWQSFLPRGYRYHIVVIRAKKEVKLRVTALRTHHAVKARGQFRCNDEVLNKIWEVSDTTLRAGMLDAFVDNNSREQAQWLHDGCVAALGAWATYGDTTLWKRGLRQWSRPIFPSGTFGSVTPTEPTFMGITDYNFMLIVSLLEYYNLTGDKDLLLEILPNLHKFTYDFIAPNMTHENLFIQPENHWCFLDWSRLYKVPYSLTLNLMALWAWRCGVEIGAICNEKRLTSMCRLWAGKMTRAITKRFWSKETKAWLEHTEPSKEVIKAWLDRIPGSVKDPWRFEEKLRLACSQHGNALAVLLRLGTEEQQAGAAALVARSLVPGQTETNMLSPLWTDKIFGALFESGHDSQAIQAFRDWHGNWLARGATAWGEGWDANADTHAQTCGAGVNWLLMSYILGVRVTKPGFKEAVFDPRPGDVSWAEGVIPTPEGNIIIRWHRGTDGRIVSKVKAPRTVKIKFPAKDI